MPSVKHNRRRVVRQLDSVARPTRHGDAATAGMRVSIRFCSFEAAVHYD